MSTYRKEKNLIFISLDNTSGDYRLDINTGVFYGIKGNPVKTCPRRSEIRSLFPYYRSENGNNLEYVLNDMFNYCASPSLFANYAEALQAADKLDALNIENLRLRKEWYAFLGQHIKELVAYLNENEWRDFNRFKRWVAFEKVRKNLGSAGDLLTPEMYWELVDDIADITIEELGVCAYYLGRGKYWEYHNGSVATLTDYISLCRAMVKTPQKVNNFMREYCETKKTYELSKTEFDNKRIAMNYAAHSKAWDFQFGDYIVVIPTCGQDIITEGERMHHCVGSYADRVVRGETFICFVRRKDTPDDCYITCQVHTNGEICQYFLAYDRFISSEEDIAFKSAFAKYLAEVWATN